MLIDARMIDFADFRFLAHFAAFQNQTREYPSLPFSCTFSLVPYFPRRTRELTPSVALLDSLKRRTSILRQLVNGIRLKRQRGLGSQCDQRRSSQVV